MVSEAGLAHLGPVRPQFHRNSSASPPRNDQVHSLITVGNLIDLVHSLVAQHKSEATPMAVGIEP
ncbi:hypothetical protein [Nocardia anaemiae]|uniref:hypothetical protein n=1 Tax=Nocardia anaemiae TaxID=263910 RepID=UPI0007A3C122|nr:hypothetical protein [Nocardia anaemiae]